MLRHHIRPWLLIAVSSALLAGGCGAPQALPGGGTASSGGDAGTPAPTTCKPRTCSQAHASCGPVGDGCGGVIQCGTCRSPQTCGGGGKPSMCGQGSNCLRRTCASAGANCGPVADGCGGTIDCGSCVAPEVCGATTPSVCGGSRAPVCTGLCQQQVSCQSGTTTISGTVHAPTPPSFGAADPLYGAFVYIPNGPVAAFTPGVSCDVCGGKVSGDPIVSATTGPDGKFVLPNVPVGADIPLVIQLGRWRRRFTIPMVRPCVDNPLPDDDTRMPRDHTEGDIPHIAMVTGSADPMECMLRKLGIADSEFTKPGGGGRVDMYVASQGGGVALSSGSTDAGSLVGSLATLKQYDMVIFACTGDQYIQSSSALANVVAYANAGGRIFATHFSYVWLFQNSPFSSTATWDSCTMGGGGLFGGGGDSCDSNDGTVTATVDQSFARGQAFAKWLVNVGASTSPGQIDLSETRHNFDAVNKMNAQRWLYDSSQPFHYTFNTPVGAPNGMQCGKVLYSDFHVNAGGGGGFGSNFPGECDSSAMTPQEKALEFMLFDLSSCVPPTGKH